MNHYLSEELYPAAIADLHVNFMDSVKGMSLYVTGYNEKLDLVIEIIIEKLKRFRDFLEETAFETYKKQLKKDCHNNFIKPDSLSYDLLNNVISKDSYTSLEIYQEVDRISIDDLKEFSEAWLQELQIQVLMQGNLKRSHCVEIVQKIVKDLDCREIKDRSLIEERSRKLPQGNNYLRVKSLQPGNKNSITVNYYQMGERSVKLDCMLELFNLIQKEPLFDTLRTKQQLGYVVYGYRDNSNNLLGLIVAVMSQQDKNSTDFVDERIEEFLTDKMLKFIEEMTDEEFETRKQSLIKLKKIVDNHLNSEFWRNYMEIIVQDYMFDRNEKYVKFLETLKKTDILEFYKGFIKVQDARKFSVQVVGSLEESVEAGDEKKNVNLEILTEKVKEQENLVTDVVAFRNSLYLYPVLKTKF
jgi:nardilysin